MERMCVVDISDALREETEAQRTQKPDGPFHSVQHLPCTDHLLFQVIQNMQRENVFPAFEVILGKGYIVG